MRDSVRGGSNFLSPFYSRGLESFTGSFGSVDSVGDVLGFGDFERALSRNLLASFWEAARRVGGNVCMSSL